MPVEKLISRCGFLNNFYTQILFMYTSAFSFTKQLWVTEDSYEVELVIVQETKSLNMKIELESSKVFWAFNRKSGS